MLASLLLNLPVPLKKGRPTGVYAEKIARTEPVYAGDVPKDVVLIAPPEGFEELKNLVNDDEDAVVFLTLLH